MCAAGQAACIFKTFFFFFKGIYQGKGGKRNRIPPQLLAPPPSSLRAPHRRCCYYYDRCEGTRPGGGPHAAALSSPPSSSRGRPERDQPCAVSAAAAPLRPGGSGGKPGEKPRAGGTPRPARTRTHKGTPSRTDSSPSTLCNPSQWKFTPAITESRMSHYPFY